MVRTGCITDGAVAYLLTELIEMNSKRNGDSIKIVKNHKLEFTDSLLRKISERVINLADLGKILVGSYRPLLVTGHQNCLTQFL